MRLRINTVTIWVDRLELITGDVTKFWLEAGFEDAVQVSVSVDEFTRLLDNSTTSEQTFIIEKTDQLELPF